MASLTSVVVRKNGLYGGADKRPMVMGGTAIERSMMSMGSIAIYNVKPVMTKGLYSKEHKRYTLYAVHVQNAITGRSWVVHRRYTDFMVLQTLVNEHFEQVRAVFPKLHTLVNDLYFPPKHKISSNTGRVVQHRCTAFLEYLVTLHRLLISQCYMEQLHVSETGSSIMRGFLGSTNVNQASHNASYTIPTPILQCKLVAADRATVNQCGTLKTVLEDDLEYEDCEEEEEEEEVPVRESELSAFSDSDSHTTASDLEDVHDSPMRKPRRQRSTKKESRQPGFLSVLVRRS
ncbi:hypothetical protein Poli38472_005303 [Pythium oligandrum]|uniref:PX domain-containing protein n=1 Tax=Pythium oligandrum TaxID=41045 RepID=A0A8K1FGE8_PYTOL|nr:hypothetical protein Poli38472_005303 [Pythium oligandrum]|eukprot:TMW62685.1 hypothetical protein Poli38472_005303 [Pythium oligandrum]